MANYNIRAVVMKTGLNAATLRTWERRYNAVEPIREANGTRTYDEAAVHRVQLLKRVTDIGHAIRHMAGLDDAALEVLLKKQPAERRTNALAQSCIEQLLNSVDAMDLPCFERVVCTAALAFGPSALVEDVLAPMLEAVGERWHAGQLSIAQEHAVCASLSNVLGALIRSYPAPSAAAPVILASLPGERHELVLQLVRYVLTSLSVPVVYLGIDLPAAEIARTAQEQGSRVIALTMIHGDGVAQQRAHLQELLSQIPEDTEVWIGGAQCEDVADGIVDTRLHRIGDIRALEKRVWLSRGHTA